MISYAGDISLVYDISMAEEWLTTAEVAELSGYHVIYLPQLIRDNNIEARNVTKQATISTMWVEIEFNNQSTQGYFLPQNFWFENIG